MRPSEVLEHHRESIRDTAKRFGATKVLVFGSAARGADSDSSDLDLLVEMRPGTTLLDMVGLQQELESALGISVDVLTPNDLPERVRRRVFQEARPL